MHWDMVDSRAIETENENLSRYKQRRLRREPDFPAWKMKRKNNLRGVGRMLKIVLGISSSIYTERRISR